MNIGLSLVISLEENFMKQPIGIQQKQLLTTMVFV